MSGLVLQLDGWLTRLVRTTQALRQQHARPGWLAAAVALLDVLARGVAHLRRNHRYYTLPKLANMALVNLQFRLKTQRVLGRPYRMKIESTNICNTHCQLCPTGLGLAGRAKGKMTFEQYAGLIDRLRWHLAAVDLSMWGDPLIVPDIFRMIRYAHDRRIWTYISSNLHAYKPAKDHGRALVESGLDLLTCSLHGASQEAFAVYQPGKSLGDVVAKVRDLLEARQRLGRRTPAVQLNFVVTRHNEQEMAAFRRLARELDCKAVFSWPSLNVRLLDRGPDGRPLGLPHAELDRRRREHLHQWLPRDQAYVLEAYRLILEGKFDPQTYNGGKLYDCSWPWQASVINWDGNVVTCCGSWEPREDLGNVFEQPFGRIWNSPRYRLARRSFRRRLDPAQARDNPCAGCPGFMI